MAKVQISANIVYCPNEIDSSNYRMYRMKRQILSDSYFITNRSDQHAEENKRQRIIL